MATKIVTGVVRLSYEHIWHAATIGNSTEAKFSAAFLIPKTDKSTLEAVQGAIKAEALAAYPNGKLPLNYKTALLKDGDKIDRPETKGHYVLNASSKTRPGIVDKNRQEIIDVGAVYSGCYVKVQLAFSAYDTPLNKGVGCYLNNVLLVKDGASLAGRDDPKDVGWGEVNDAADYSLTDVIVDM